MTKKLRPIDQQDEIQAAFKAFDKDNDGFISAEELQDFMENLGQHLTFDEILEMIKDADEDKDGKINYHGKGLTNYINWGSWDVKLSMVGQPSICVKYTEAGQLKPSPDHGWLK